MKPLLPLSQRRITTVLTLLLLLTVFVERGKGALLREQELEAGFPPTPVFQSAMKQVIVRGLQPGASAFAVDEAPSAPFRLVNGNGITITNGEARLEVSFLSQQAGRYTDTIILRRRPALPQNNDEVKIVLTAEAFVPVRRTTLNFGRIATGDTSRRVVVVREDIVRDFLWTVSDRVTAPFFVVNRIPAPVADTFGFMVHFRPIVGGEYVDSAVFVRYDKDDAQRVNPIDTLVARLVGIAVDLDKSIQTDFGPVLTGDVRTVRLGAELIGGIKPTYVIKQQPESEVFTVPDKPTVERDSIIVSVKASPLREGRFSDRVIYERRSPDNRPIDDVTIDMTVTAVGMPQVETIILDQVAVGTPQIKDVTIDLGADLYGEGFRYRIVTVEQGLASLTLTSPQAGTISRDRRIGIRARGESTTFQTGVRQKFLLIRTTLGGVDVDSTEIVVSTTMRPRPVAIRFGVVPERREVRIGDTVRVSVRAFTDGVIDIPVRFSEAQCSIAYNSSVVVASEVSGTELTRTVMNDRAVVVLTSDGTISESGAEVAAFSAVAVMGNDVRTPLDLLNVTAQFTDDVTGRDLDSGEIVLTNVWQYPDGRIRLVNSNQGPLELSVSPNPLETTTTISIGNVPQGKGILQIVSPEGVVLADYSAEVRDGATTVSVSKSAIDGLTAGTYIVRLAAETETGIVNSVVRLLVVR